MRRLVLLPGICFLLAVMGIAFAADCVTLTRASAEMVRRTDDELVGLEQRLLRAIDGWEGVPADVRLAADRYREATGREDRHERYQSLAAAVLRARSLAPPSGEVGDVIAGAMNRRRTAEQAYDEAKKADLQWQSSTRGVVARRVLDWWK